MIVVFPCPYAPCEAILECHVDTIGDPSVNVPPDGLENVEIESGECVHVAAINDDLAEEDEDFMNMHYPTFMAALEKRMDENARQEAEADAQWELWQEREPEGTDDDAS